MSFDTRILCRRYQKVFRRRRLFIVAAGMTVLAAVIVGLCVGSSGMSPGEVVSSLFRDNGRNHTIIWMLRMPRVTIALLVGFGMGLAGAVFQAILRNPLASPFTLGVGSGAGFGAVAAILFFGGSFQSSRIALCAFLFSLVSALFILAVAELKRASAETMIMAGIAQMFLFTSLSSFLQYMGTMEQINEIVFWFFGSLSKAGWNEIALSALMVLLPYPLLLRSAWNLNLLSSGDESAASLGVNVKRLRMGAVVLASLVTAGGICFTGVIGFVGLVAPHITRMIIGNDHRYLLTGSGLLGAAIVVSADTIGRMMWAPQVIPVGIVTSFIGVPFFLYLLMRRNRELW